MFTKDLWAELNRKPANMLFTLIHSFTVSHYCRFFHRFYKTTIKLKTNMINLLD